MDGPPEGGATLAIHTVATVEDFEILRRIDIVSVKVWLLRRWRLAQGFFDALIVKGETMDIFACGLGRMGNGFFDAIITFITFIGCVLALLTVFAVAVVKGRKSGGSV